MFKREYSPSKYNGVTWHTRFCRTKLSRANALTVLRVDALTQLLIYAFTDPLGWAYDTAARKRYGEFAVLNFQSENKTNRRAYVSHINMQ